MEHNHHSPDDQETVSRVLRRMENLTAEEWQERLAWVPEGCECERVEPDGRAETPADGERVLVASALPT